MINMKGSAVFVFMALVSMTCGTSYCPESSLLNSECGNGGKCINPKCVDPTGVTILSTAAPPTTPAGSGPTAAPAGGGAAGSSGGSGPTAAPAGGAAGSLGGSGPTAAPAGGGAAGSSGGSGPTAAPVSGRKNDDQLKKQNAPRPVYLQKHVYMNAKVTSGSIKHAVSPMVLLIGVFAKLFIR
ncbi:uncharacterized protein [Argopecten irradians]|uniref:uncharacterized protein n=1 Tax=Argopecten irradians TaxID=31199 RepID=UPI003712AFA7